MSALYDSKSQIDDRGLKQILSKEHTVECWLKVERALAKAQSELKMIPEEAYLDIEHFAKIENVDFYRMDQEKEIVGHGFASFLRTIRPALHEEGRKYLHYGCTTQNIQQTAQMIQMKEIYSVLYSFISDILENLSMLASEHAYTIMPGRTHGKHAIPITYGYKCSVWISDLLDCIDRMKESEKRIFTVMMGGAVGAFSAMQENGRKVQGLVAKELEMNEMDVPSRNRSGHKVEYLMVLSLLANTFHKFAEEVYYTGMEEFKEVSESYVKGTIGSSTMPQKINPKLAKGIIANSQKLYGLISTSLYSSCRMFEADSSSYMLFDGLLVEASELICEIIIRMEELTRTLQVNVENMKRNAHINKGLDNSEYIMMCLAKKIGKEKAHEVVYEDAVEAQIYQANFKNILLNDERINNIFTDSDIISMMQPENYIGQCAELANEMSDKAHKKSVELKRMEYKMESK